MLAQLCKPAYLMQGGGIACGQVPQRGFSSPYSPSALSAQVPLLRGRFSSAHSEFAAKLEDYVQVVFLCLQLRSISQESMKFYGCGCPL
jgi:hypothetical protein